MTPKLPRHLSPLHPGAPPSAQLAFLRPPPAIAQWLRDGRRTMMLIRTLENSLWELLDFAEQRAIPMQLVAQYASMDRADATRCVQTLIDWGYVIEHGRGKRGVRLLTLAWSVRPVENVHNYAAESDALPVPPDAST